MGKRQLYALLFAVLIVVGFVGYQKYQTNTVIAPTTVVIAVQDIPPHTKIESNMVREINDIPIKGVPPGIYHSKKEVVGKWTQVDYGIAQNGYLFHSKVVEEKELLDAERMKLMPGQRIFTTTVDIETSAAGNVIPGSVVDVWLTSIGQDKKMINGRVYRGLYVLSAKNRKAENIVTNNTTNPPPKDKNGDTSTEQNKQKELVPSIVQLAVDDEQWQMLQAAKELGTISMVPKEGQLYKNAADVPDLSNEPDPFDIKPLIMKQIQNVQLQALKEGGMKQ